MATTPTLGKMARRRGLVSGLWASWKVIRSREERLREGKPVSGRVTSVPSLESNVLLWPLPRRLLRPVMDVVTLSPASNQDCGMPASPAFSGLALSQPWSPGGHGICAKQLRVPLLVLG